jgi:hypothetical protein
VALTDVHTRKLTYDRTTLVVEREIKLALEEAHYTSLEEAVKDARTEIEHREK